MATLKEDKSSLHGYDASPNCLLHKAQHLSCMMVTHVGNQRNKSFLMGEGAGVFSSILNYLHIFKGFFFFFWGGGDGIGDFWAGGH